MEKAGEKGTETKTFLPPNFFPACGIEGMEGALFERHAIFTTQSTIFGVGSTRIQVMSPCGSKRGMHMIWGTAFSQKIMVWGLPRRVPWWHQTSKQTWTLVVIP